MPFNATPELYALVIISTATALMWVPYVCGRMLTHGVLRAIGTPGPGYPVDEAWMDRAKRAHVNAVENLAVFAPLVIVSAVTGINNGTTLISAYVYVAARLLHYVIYTAGIPVVRTVAFLAGACATVVLGVTLLVAML